MRQMFWGLLRLKSSTLSDTLGHGEIEEFHFVRQFFWGMAAETEEFCFVEKKLGGQELPTAVFWLNFLEISDILNQFVYQTMGR